MKNGYDILSAAVREAANDNLGAEETVTRIINDLDFAGLTILRRYLAVDYAKPIQVIKNDDSATYSAVAWAYGASVTDLRGRPGHLVMWQESGQMQAAWFDGEGANSRLMQYRVTNVLPAPSKACSASCVNCRELII